MDSTESRKRLPFRLTVPRYGAMCVAFTVGVAAIGTARAADDLLGLYVGGSMGRSDIHLDNTWTATRAGADEVVVRHTGWTASVGVRPLRYLGAEFQYLDFGKAHWDRTDGNTPTGFQNPVSTTVHTNAEALAAVLYAPIPVPFLDVYAKLGPAHWHSTVNGEIFGLPCPNTIPNCGQVAVKQDRTDLVYGAGLQFRLGSGAVRMEYERIEAHPEYPFMYQIGLTWTF
jgi:hypothetical protein